MADDYKFMTVDRLLSLLRQRGWEIGNHVDIRYNNFPGTRYLLIHRSGIFILGEGVNDRAALVECLTFADAHHLDTTWKAYSPYQTTVADKEITLKFSSSAKALMFSQWLARRN